MQDFRGLRAEWEGADNFQREQIITSMGRLGGAESWEFIRNALSDSKVFPHVRGWAARTLGGSADQKTVAVLLNRLEWDMDPFVKSMCAASIAKLAEYINTLGRATRETAISALRDASGNDDLVVRQKAALGLAGFMDGKSQDVMVRTVIKLDILEGVTDYEEISLALCRMGVLEVVTVLAFAKTMETSHDLALAEKMMDATGKLLRKFQMDETWRSRLMGAMRVCKNRLEANRRPAGESFVDKTLGIRFERPRRIAQPIPPLEKAK
ncbi:MAG: HEAT repeat domain-containing protein [Candidatus ainarchaeum sp.]|nr:HEAT repeat domain-containing protein [Candidatus ainarchaeum sp.]MDD5096347.1 HEAT repeat domain-containing protein [Candidatus ainarchaeum sp.]